jgi:MFS family permease
MAVSIGIANFLSASSFSVLFPVFVNDEFGRASVLGILAAAFGVGGLAGAVIFGALGHRLPRRAMWIASFLASPLVLLAPWMTSSLPILLLVLTVTAIFTGPINALMVTIRHERIPSELRGRVFSTFSAITAVATPLGILIAGYAVESLGLSVTLLTIAILELALAVGIVLTPAFKEMDATREHAEVAA